MEQHQNNANETKTKSRSSISIVNFELVNASGDSFYLFWSQNVTR